MPRVDAAIALWHEHLDPIPSSTSMTLLHSMTVDSETWDVYLAVLGGKLPPQKWVASWSEGQRPASHQ
jgi:hypothetical protein